jgi:hypothetical protein
MMQQTWVQQSQHGFGQNFQPHGMPQGAPEVSSANPQGFTYPQNNGMSSQSGFQNQHQPQQFQPQFPQGFPPQQSQYQNNMGYGYSGGGFSQGPQGFYMQGQAQGYQAFMTNPQQYAYPGMNYNQQYPGFAGSNQGMGCNYGMPMNNQYQGMQPQQQALGGMQVSNSMYLDTSSQSLQASVANSTRSMPALGGAYFAVQNGGNHGSQSQYIPPSQGQEKKTGEEQGSGQPSGIVSPDPSYIAGASVSRPTIQGELPLEASFNNIAPIESQQSHPEGLTDVTLELELASMIGSSSSVLPAIKEIPKSQQSAQARKLYNKVDRRLEEISNSDWEDVKENLGLAE